MSIMETAYSTLAKKLEPFTRKIIREILGGQNYGGLPTMTYIQGTGFPMRDDTGNRSVRPTDGYGFDKDAGDFQLNREYDTQVTQGLSVVILGGENNISPFASDVVVSGSGGSGDMDGGWCIGNEFGYVKKFDSGKAEQGDAQTFIHVNKENDEMYNSFVNPYPINVIWAYFRSGSSGYNTVPRFWFLETLLVGKGKQEGGPEKHFMWETTWLATTDSSGAVWDWHNDMIKTEVITKYIEIPESEMVWADNADDDSSYLCLEYGWKERKQWDFTIFKTACHQHIAELKIDW